MGVRTSVKEEVMMGFGTEGVDESVHALNNGWGRWSYDGRVVWNG